MNSAKIFNYKHWKNQDFAQCLLALAYGYVALNKKLSLE